VLPIDRVNFKILRILRQDARTPFVEVARQVGMTEGAIRARVKRMTQDGTIERFTVVSRAAGIRALVAIRTRPSGSTDKVGRAVRRVGGVTSVLEVTGEQDLFALVEVVDTAALNRAIEHVRRIPAVVETQSMTVLNEH
jgi:DNA-binding Lrp family transcriptional regulator